MEGLRTEAAGGFSRYREYISNPVHTELHVRMIITQLSKQVEPGRNKLLRACTIKTCDENVKTEKGTIIIM